MNKQIMSLQFQTKIFFNSLYIHFPFCESICNYCDFHKIAVGHLDQKLLKKKISEFESNIESSFHQLKETLLSGFDHQLGPLKTVYIGGGSPSVWGAEGATFLKKFLLDNFRGHSNNHEWTIELNPNINEMDLENYYALLTDAGFNRFSLGIQTLNQKYYKLLDRKYAFNYTLKAMEFFHQKRTNFSVDLLLGAPNPLLQKNYDRKIEEELEIILNYTPTHLSTYILTPKENYPKSLLRTIPEDEIIQKEYLKVSEVLSKNGFIHYEVSNFAKPGFESKHNFEYWKLGSVLALGPSATGFIKESSNQLKGFRYTWNKNLENGIEGELLGKEEIWLEKLYLGLRTNEGVNLSEFLVKDQVLESDLLKTIEKWEQRGYLQTLLPITKLTSKGFIMLDSLMDDIFLLTSKTIQDNKG